MKPRILVFPCGSEIGLEIHRAVRYSTHFELVGASSVQDHGRFVYTEYIGGIPFHDSSAFLPRLVEIIQEHSIDAIYPTMDAVADTLQDAASWLGIRVIGSSPQTTKICASKQLTYDALKDVIPVPQRYPGLRAVCTYPVFLKPDRGYGSRNTFCATNEAAARAHLEKCKGISMLILEHLPGSEWTIDCFSDRHGNLLYHSPRIRNRISNGISVNTSHTTEFQETFYEWARNINEALRPRGAWFFQAKLAADGTPRLLEVATRFAGSSALQRAKGVNLPLLSLFDTFGLAVKVAPNRYEVELDRALENRFRLALEYRYVYVDLDDCILIEEKINHQLIAFLYKAINDGCSITLLSRHAGNLEETLNRFRIRNLFDAIVHITDHTKKSSYIIHDPKESIFIDDSFKEREDAAKIGVSVFSPDMVEALF